MFCSQLACLIQLSEVKINVEEVTRCLRTCPDQNAQTIVNEKLQHDGICREAASTKAIS